MRSYLVLVILVIIGALLIGCTQPSAPAASAPAANPQAQAAPQAASQQSQSSVPASAGSGQTATVVIKDRAFSPNMLYISAGTTVTWVNEDTLSHRVVHLPGNNQDEIFHSDRLDPGQSYSYTFTVPNRYYYADPQYAGGREDFVNVS